MADASVCGRIHSVQSLGTVDGPGVRFVAFLSGCPLRCSCCHNPDTRDPSVGDRYTARELVDKAARFRSYFGAEGGITLSGGEPLCQAAFVCEIFRLCREEGIHTCLDTSGYILSDGIREALRFCDRVLLDIKYTNEEDYLRYAGASLSSVLAFLGYLNEQNIPTTLRQVIIPTVNDNSENLAILRSIAAAYPCVDKVELLPFRKICQVKYDDMGIPFPFAHLPEADPDTVRQMEEAFSTKK